MKRDMDLVRNILLAVEASSFPDMSQLMKILGEGRRDWSDPVCYHLRMLVEEIDLLSAVDAKSNSGPNWLRIELTWSGHEFLDAVRDSEIWSKTKAGAEMAGGFSIDLIFSLAKGFLKKKIESQTGISLDL